MKLRNALSVLFGLLFAGLLSAGILLALCMGDTPVITDHGLSAADAQAERFMEAVCSGDYAAAEKLLSGTPTLSFSQAHSNALSETLWNEYLSALSYEFHGSCYTDGCGLYRDVTVTLLDLPRLLEELQGRSVSAVTEQPAEELAETAAAMLSQQDYTTTRTLSLQLTSHRGQWMIRPTTQLINLLQGGMGGT